ncbi:hypothetical protein BKA70DRAFT_115394 [Coprinopsis sp. MPI-PUGE-AT-0042]|nr:hypothetical protein BKA70DRAFT_115394 [Coprinopsis sp. MPI-PUGE-AT-0042]
MTRCSFLSCSRVASLARQIPVYGIAMASFISARSCPRCRLLAPGRRRRRWLCSISHLELTPKCWPTFENTSMPSRRGLKIAYTLGRLLVKVSEETLSFRNLATYILFDADVPLPQSDLVHEYSRRLIPSAQCCYGVPPEGPSQSNLHPQNYPPVAHISVASGNHGLKLCASLLPSIQATIMGFGQ